MKLVGQIGLLKENINNKTNWGLGYILRVSIMVGIMQQKGLGL